MEIDIHNNIQLAHSVWLRE